MGLLADHHQRTPALDTIHIAKGQPGQTPLDALKPGTARNKLSTADRI